MNHSPRRTHASVIAASAALALTLVAGSAHAGLKTWYVGGNFDDANCGTPLQPKLAAAYPSGTSFKGHFTFDDGATGILITDGRYDFLTSSEQGGSVQLITKKYTLNSSSSRLITTVSTDGAGNVYEQLTLNANTYTTGADSKKYGSAALDLVTMGEKGAGYPWFAYGSIPASPPTLASANYGQSCVDIFYFDSTTSEYFHRFGNVTVLQDTPF